MKQILFLVAICVGFSGCNTEPKPEDAKTDSAVAKEPIVYPFTPKYSLNWQPGDEKNALLVLNAIKSFNEGDIKAALADFGDSVEFVADKFHFKGGKDSLTSIITAERAAVTSISQVYDTWLTAYYPDKGDTWVTLWYTEKWTDKKGKTDSIYYTDDVLIRNGKIVEYDKKQRAFPVPMTKK